MIRLSGYSLLRCDRVGRSGGEMAFYLTDHFRVFILCCSYGSVTDRPEFIMAEIIFHDRSKLLLAVVYQPPNSGYLNNYRHSIILGDFNSSLYLVSFMFTHHFRNSSTLLDLCIIDRDKLKKFGQHGVAFLSAHDLIFIRYGIKLQLCRDWSGFDAASFQSDVGNIDWTDVNLPAPWLTDGIRIMMRDRDLAKRTWCRHKNDVYYDQYKMLRKILCVLQSASKASEVWDRLSHLGLIKATNTGGRLAHFVEELNAFFEHNAEHADYMEDGSLRDILERNFDDRSFHWHYAAGYRESDF
ncbi:hypothetical protein ACFW04_012308 [Cataglyphis niger]